MKRIPLSPYIILTFVGTFCIPGTITAQRANSLYFLEQTPFHTQWNPAMAPKRSGMGVGLSSFSLSFQSDLAFSDLFIPSEDGTELYTFMHPSVDKNAFVEGLKDVSSFNYKSSMDIFNLGIRMKNSYFSIHSAFNIDAGMGMPKDFFGMFLLGMDENQTSTQFDLTGMNINAMAYAKFGVGYSLKLGKMLSVGINANYLLGIADMRMGFDQLTVDASETQWDVTSNGYIQMAVPEAVSFGYNENGYMNGFKFDSKSFGNASGIASSIPKAGSGVSFDLGATLKPLPFLTLSAAINDLGSIKWSENCIQRAKANGTFTYEGVALNKEGEESMSSSDAVTSFEEMIHFEKDNAVQSYSSKLTTKLNIGAEAGILKNRISFGVLSQTGFATDGTYHDIMISANLKPSSIIQTALTYSLLHGAQSSFGAAVNANLLLFNIFIAADCIPTLYTPQFMAVNNSYFNMQFGFNMMF